MEVTKEFYNQENSLICLIARVQPSKAQGRGWRSMEYIYTLWGAAAKSREQPDTLIVRSYNKAGEGEVGEVENVVAEYRFGKWTFLAPLY